MQNVITPSVALFVFVVGLAVLIIVMATRKYESAKGDLRHSPWGVVLMTFFLTLLISDMPVIRHIKTWSQGVINTVAVQISDSIQDTTTVDPDGWNPPVTTIVLKDDVVSGFPTLPTGQEWYVDSGGTHFPVPASGSLKLSSKPTDVKVFIYVPNGTNSYSVTIKQS